MYQNTITLFNFHSATGMWYPTIIPGVDLIGVKASSATKEGTTNGDTVDIIINCKADKSVVTSGGVLKCYTAPKAYASCDEPQNFITFKPESDFIYDGAWDSTEPIEDEIYESGLYHAINDENDGVYMISSATFYSLIPHFEIGGR